MPRQGIERNNANLGFVDRYKYHVLIGSYIALTSVFFWRVHRQPYSRSIKAEQYETIFKGTTLAAVVAGVAVSSSGREKYRRPREGA
ncbi:uncharacterized protein JN550_001470 [Neoarthrinium moseri]|uniref:uncharacterized protein n=1 Tax=Neoarthrinium moseri TaxID=1658444 RepID=UPI001FDC1D9F|nr:uncharacterized protein JN550_001470 [Neoarthrinium moseri]KAI1875974.1 hypothetical protein JN550_001470 [Neoarthrinium moseri]